MQGQIQKVWRSGSQEKSILRRKKWPIIWMQLKWRARWVLEELEDLMTLIRALKSDYGRLQIHLNLRNVEDNFGNPSVKFYEKNQRNETWDKKYFSHMQQVVRTCANPLLPLSELYLLSRGSGNLSSATNRQLCLHSGTTHPWGDWPGDSPPD